MLTSQAKNEVSDATGFLTLINELRSQGCDCGDRTMPAVDPVSWNELLEEAALIHTKDMSENNHFSHTGTDGSNLGERINRTGYNHNGAAENIALGQQDEERVFRAWRESPGHCRNMMNVNYEHIGLARVGNYWTLKMARQR